MQPAAAKKAVVIDSGWYDADETRAKLGLAERTLRTWVQQGRIQTKMSSVPGKRPQRLYSAADVERLKTSGPPAVVPKPVRESASSARVLPQTRVNAALLHMLEMMQQRALPMRPAKPWLTPEEASELAGLTPAYIRRQIDAKRIRAVRGGPHGALRIHRASLEEFRGEPEWDAIVPDNGLTLIPPPPRKPKKPKAKGKAKGAHA
jgi:excisionase family DNA binding protein